MFFLSGLPASVVSPDTSYATRFTKMALPSTVLQPPVVALPQPCAEGWVMSEFGCVNPTGPGVECPPGSQQTGYGCLPTNTTPPAPTSNVIVYGTPKPPRSAPPSAAPVIPVDVPAPGVPVPTLPGQTEQTPTPGMVITTTASPLFGRVPSWTWWVGGAGIVAGIATLIARRGR